MGQKISSCIDSCGSCSNSVSPSYWNYEKLKPQPDDSFNLKKHPQDCERLKKSQEKGSFNLQKHPQDCEKSKKSQEKDDSFNLQKHPQDCEKLKKSQEKDDSFYLQKHPQDCEKLKSQEKDSFYLQIHPQELHFPFELRKEISCTLRLSNKSDHYVAFKVRTTEAKKYYVSPNITVVKPGSTLHITVTLRAQKEEPRDLQCKDTFYIQRIVASPGATAADITSEMFYKESGYEVKECKLRVVYVAPPPKPNPQFKHQFFSDQTRELTSKLTKERNSAIDKNKRLQQELAVISKITKERNSVIQQNKRFQQELKLLKREANKDYPIQ